MCNPVHFVGAGPGADDLITLRGASLLASADVVIHAGSLVNPTLLARCKPDCAIHDSAALDLEAQVALMAEGVRTHKLVVRLHTGEPSVYGAIGEQMDALKRLGIACRVTPGVSSVFAAAAALECELTRPGLSQSVVLTRTPGRTPMPEGETAAAFARTGATLAFFLSVGKLDELADELTCEGGLAAHTPAAVVYRASWPDEVVVRGTLATIAAKTREAGLKRQALVLVGQALDPFVQQGETSPEASKLYAGTFSHGYRNQLQDESFTGRCALWAFTEKGLAQARSLSTGLGLPCDVLTPAHRAGKGDIPFPPGGFETAMAEHWGQYDAHIVIGATGIAVRGIAPHLLDKAADPAVISCPDTGVFVLPLVSGHLGGANRLARRVARITGGEALISTATDLQQLPAFDEAAAQEGAVVLNPEALRVCNAALLDENANIDFVGPRHIFEHHFAACKRIRYVSTPTDGIPVVIWLTGASPAPLSSPVPLSPPAKTVHGTDQKTEQTSTRLFIRERTVVLGVGCRKDADPATLEIAVRDWFLRRGTSLSRLAAVATCELKATEPAVVQLATTLGVPLVTHAESMLESVQTPTPSQRVAANVGTPSVAEAAALLTASRLGADASLLAPKQSLDSLTLALATCSPHSTAANDTNLSPGDGATGTLTVVGLGSGSLRHITPEVRRTLHLCSHIAGYSGYVDLIRPLVVGKTIIETPMRGEVERCRDALDAALQGHAVCMVCSGDPGVLAMAGLIYELRDLEPRFAAVPVAVFPGITAANLAAAALGAPLQNGFTLISLSDLLVPADEVRQNVAAASESALPLVLYNPAGRKRRTLMEESLDLLIRKRGPQTPAAMVREAGRPNEQKWLGQLKNLPRERVDMSTLIVVGGPRTRLRQGVLFEERGYADARVHP